MWNKQRPLAIIFTALAVLGLVSMLQFVITGRVNELMDGIGIEVLGALLTALGIIGLDQLYNPPDERIDTIKQQVGEQNDTLEALKAQITEQSAKIDALTQQLEAALAHLSPPEAPPVQPDEETLSD